MTIIRTKRLGNGTYVEMLPDGSTRPSQGKTDWAHLDDLTEDDLVAAALSDPDSQPLTDETARMRKRLPQARVIRRALNLTQEEFSARYHIPVGTLRDWEQGRSEPDQPTRAYLRVIAGDPEGVRRTLEARPAIAG